MADMRQELMEQHRNGPDTYIGQLCFRAAEEIRRLENENHYQAARIAGARAALSVKVPE